MPRKKRARHETQRRSGPGGSATSGPTEHSAELRPSQPKRSRSRALGIFAIGAFVVIVIAVGSIRLARDPEPRRASTARPQSLSIPEIADLDGLDPAFAGAVREAVSAAREASERGDLFGELGKLYDAHQYYELARQCYEIAQQLDPRTADWPYYLGAFAAERGRLSDAARDFRRAASLRPDYPPIYLRLGDSLLRAGVLDEAESAYGDFLQRDSDSGWGHLGLAKIARRRGRPLEAAERLERAVVLEPGDTEITYLLAMTYRELGRNQDAAPLLDQFSAGTTTARKPDPLMRAVLAERKDLQSLIQAANRSLASAKPADAEALYRAVLAQDPDHYDALHNLGIVYGRTRRFSEAEAFLVRAIQQRPESTEARHELAMAYASQQKLARAVEELRRTLDVDPEYAPSRKMLADLEHHMKVPGARP